MYVIQKSGPTRKNFGVILQATLKTAFQIRIYPKDTHKQEKIFQNQGTFLCVIRAFYFPSSEKGRGDLSPLSSASCERPYVVGNNTAEFLSELTEIAERFFAWFDNNKIKAKHKICYLLLTVPKERNIQVPGTTIKKYHRKKLLVVHFSTKLKFDTHVENTCEKANRKLNALVKIAPFINLYNRKIIMQSLFNSRYLAVS